MSRAILTRVASVQMQPVLDDVTANVDRTVALIGRSADLGAKLTVLPELASSGYAFATRDEALAAAETIGDSLTVRRWQAIARERDIHVVAGIAERNGTMLHNTAVLIGPEGVIGRYRKNQLWNREREFFEPGDLGFPVFSTAIGRIGLCICYDAWFPETFRLLALGGADFVCMPTNWVRPAEGFVAPEGAPYTMAHMMLFAAAHSNSLPIVAADRIGAERGVQFEGRSVIVGHTGWPVTGPAGYDNEEVIIGDLDLVRARSDREWSPYNNILADRRTELYGRLSSPAP